MGIPGRKLTIQISWDANTQLAVLANIQLKNKPKLSLETAKNRLIKNKLKLN